MQNYQRFTCALVREMDVDAIHVHELRFGQAVTIGEFIQRQFKPAPLESESECCYGGDYQGQPERQYDGDRTN